MYTPISTEKGFYKTWYPIIEKLQLHWFTHMTFGLDIAKDNVNDVLIELSTMREWIMKTNGRIAEVERLDNFEKMIKKSFELDENVVIYVG